MNSGIYIHIPFCVKKCNYCAFLSAPATKEKRAEYVDVLIREIELRAKDYGKQARGDSLGQGTLACRQFDSIYFGGGTPSVLKAEQIEKILNAIRENYEICEGAEITLEANPGTLGDSDEEARIRLRDYRRMGINRLSMGVQSMDNERLKFLGRIHDAAMVRREFGLAREAGFDNINLDIMFSVPGETLEDAINDITEIASMGPEHISFYSLQIEEGTRFYELWADKKFDEVDDETDRQTFHKGSERLAELGYEHYEISNFAKPGHRSRHNSKYWAMEDYLAFGLGASGFVTEAEGRRVRYKNLSEMPAYQEAVMRGELPTEEEHINDEHDNVSETLFTGLRRREGVRYDACFGRGDAKEEFWKYYADVRSEAEGFVRSGHLIIDDNGLRLTETGIDISNKIMSLFV